MEDIAADDDLLGDMLLDSLEFDPPISTHKMNQSYRSPRYDTNSVVDLVRRRIVCERDPTKAVEELCSMSVVKKHLQGKSIRQSQAFMSHARRYMEAYLPDSGFEFALTNRYKRSTAPLASSLADASSVAESSAAGAASNARVTGSLDPGPKHHRGRRSGEIPAPATAGAKADLCVVAVRLFSPGEIIPCKGGVKDLSKAEDEALRNEAAANRGRMDDGSYSGVLGQGRDFSIIKSSMKNCSQLLLGPARFVNHDCNPSVQFYRSGQQMMFKVLRPIGVNEEILVAYGDHYFGWENSECLCATCELKGRGGYTKEGVDSLEDQEKKAAIAAEEDEPPGNGRRAPSKRTKSTADGLSPNGATTNGNGLLTESKNANLAAPESEYANRRSSSRASSGGIKSNAAPSDRELADPFTSNGPKCQCLTCGGPFYAPENWWLPDECKRCERHYRLYKADWPGRIPTEGAYAKLYQQATTKGKANGVLGSAEEEQAAKTKAKPVTKPSSSPPPLPKKRGRPPKSAVGPPLTTTPTPSVVSVDSSLSADSPIRLSPLRPLDADGDLTVISKASKTKKPGRPRNTEESSDKLTSRLNKPPIAFSDSSSDLTDASSSAATEISQELSAASSSSSGSDDRPPGPKMLGKEAKTEALAKFWGVGEADGRKRIRKPSMNGPVSLAGKVGKPSARSHHRSSSGVSAVSVFEADSEDDEPSNGERSRKKQKSASRESKASAGSQGLKSLGGGAEGTKNTSRSSSIAMSEGKPPSPMKMPASTGACSPLLHSNVGKDVQEPLDDKIVSVAAAPVSQPAQPPAIATQGAERTSIKNLAAFWSAGVDAGSRTRKQTQRDPTLASTSASPAVSSPKRGRESSGSQPPLGMNVDAKRQRGGRRSGGDESASVGGIGKVGARQESPSSSSGRRETPSEGASPMNEKVPSRPRSPLVGPPPPPPRRDLSTVAASTTMVRPQSPISRSLESLGKNGSLDMEAQVIRKDFHANSTTGAAAYRHIPGRKNLRIGRPSSASRPLSSSSPASNGMITGRPGGDGDANGKGQNVRPVVGSTAMGWPGVSSHLVGNGVGGSVVGVGAGNRSALAQVPKVEDGEGVEDRGRGTFAADISKDAIRGDIRAKMEVEE